MRLSNKTFEDFKISVQLLERAYTLRKKIPRHKLEKALALIILLLTPVDMAILVIQFPHLTEFLLKYAPDTIKKEHLF